MNTELSNSLGGFASSVNSLVPVTLILQIMAIGIGIAFSYYIIVWGAKCIIRAVKSGMNGYLADPTSYEFRNSARAKRIAQRHGYLLYDDMIQAQQFGYSNAHDYYVDYSHYEHYEFDDISNSSFREYLEAPLRGSIDDDIDDDEYNYRNGTINYYKDKYGYVHYRPTDPDDLDDDDYERYEATHPYLSKYDIDEIKKDYPDGYDDLPF